MQAFSGTPVRPYCSNFAFTNLYLIIPVVPQFIWWSQHCVGNVKLKGVLFQQVLFDWVHEFYSCNVHGDWRTRIWYYFWWLHVFKGDVLMHFLHLLKNVTAVAFSRVLFEWDICFFFFFLDSCLFAFLIHTSFGDLVLISRSQEGLKIKTNSGLKKNVLNANCLSICSSFALNLLWAYCERTLSLRLTYVQPAFNCFRAPFNLQWTPYFLAVMSVALFDLWCL